MQLARTQMFDPVLDLLKVSSVPFQDLRLCRTVLGAQNGEFW